MDDKSPPKAVKAPPIAVLLAEEVFIDLEKSTVSFNF